MTRRLFAGLLTAAGGTAAKANSFALHRILRRPYRHFEQIPACPYKLWDAVSVCVQFPWMKPRSTATCPLRVTVHQDGAPDPALQATVCPRSGEAFMLLGVHGMRAEKPAAITIEARSEFRLFSMRATFMHPPFRRIDGMIVYHDPFYRTHPETENFGQSPAPHHRKFYGPGKDVGYV